MSRLQCVIRSHKLYSLEDEGGPLQWAIRTVLNSFLLSRDCKRSGLSLRILRFTNLNPTPVKNPKFWWKGSVTLITPACHCPRLEAATENSLGVLISDFAGPRGGVGQLDLPAQDLIPFG